MNSPVEAVATDHSLAGEENIIPSALYEIL